MNSKIYWIIVITNLILSFISFNGVVIANISYLAYRSMRERNDR